MSESAPSKGGFLDEVFCKINIKLLTSELDDLDKMLLQNQYQILNQRTE